MPRAASAARTSSRSSPSPPAAPTSISSTPCAARAPARSGAPAGCRVNSQVGDRAGGCREPARRRQAQAAVEHHPDRRARLEAGQAAGQRRIVGERGAAADHDRVVGRAQPVAARPRRLAGDPSAGAGPGRDAPVERGRELQGHERPAGALLEEEAGVQRLGLGAHQPEVDLDPGLPQLRDALAVDPPVGAERRGDHPAHAGVDQRHGAGRRAAVVRAGLERDVDRGAERARAGPAQRLDLGVRPAARLGPAAAHDAAVLDHHAADRGVRPGAAEAALGQPQRQRHEAAVELIRRRRRHRVGRRPRLRSRSPSSR